MFSQIGQLSRKNDYPKTKFLHLKLSTKVIKWFNGINNVIKTLQIYLV